MNTQLRASLLTYDILNDDDDDVRAIGSSIVTQIIDNGGKNTVPLVSSQRLAAHMAKNYSHSRELCSRAMERLTGTKLSPDATSKLSPSANSRLVEAVK